MLALTRRPTRRSAVGVGVVNASYPGASGSLLTCRASSLLSSSTVRRPTSATSGSAARIATPEEGQEPGDTVVVRSRRRRRWARWPVPCSGSSTTSSGEGTPSDRAGRPERRRRSVAGRQAPAVLLAGAAGSTWPSSPGAASSIRGRRVPSHGGHRRSTIEPLTEDHDRNRSRGEAVDGLSRRRPSPEVGSRYLHARNLDRTPRPPGRHGVAGMAGSVHHDDLDQIPELVGPMPRVQTCSGVRSDDQRRRRRRSSRRGCAGRCRSCRWARRAPARCRTPPARRSRRSRPGRGEAERPDR